MGLSTTTHRRETGIIKCYMLSGTGSLKHTQKCELDAAGSEGPMVGSCEHGKKPSVFIKCSKFLDQPRDCGFLKYRAQCS